MGGRNEREGEGRSDKVRMGEGRRERERAEVTFTFLLLVKKQCQFEGKEVRVDTLGVMVLCLLHRLHCLQHIN